jgi:hypothetical protein
MKEPIEDGQPSPVLRLEEDRESGVRNRRVVPGGLVEDVDPVVEILKQF